MKYEWEGVHEFKTQKIGARGPGLGTREKWQALLREKNYEFKTHAKCGAAFRRHCQRPLFASELRYSGRVGLPAIRHGGPCHIWRSSLPRILLFINMTQFLFPAMPQYCLVSDPESPELPSCVAGQRRWPGSMKDSSNQNRVSLGFRPAALACHTVYFGVFDGNAGTPGKRIAVCLALAPKEC